MQRNSRMSLGGIGSNIGDPDKFQLASVVTKDSRSITSNRRLLVIRNGHLYYYSNIPKFFNGDPKVLQNFHELPKCSINVVKINKINGFEPFSSYFSIQFQARHMMQREDIRKTLTNEEYNFAPKSTSEEVTWQFTCDNQFIKQRWVSALTNLKEHFTKEQANMQKYFENINHLSADEPKSSSYGSLSSRSSVKIPWRESIVSRKSYNLDTNKGFEFKDSSPKSPQSDSIKIEDIVILQKGRSGDLPSRKPDKYNDFQIIIEEDPKPIRLQDAFKISQVKKEEPQKTEKVLNFQPTIQEVTEDISVPQTPLRQSSVVSEESQEHPHQLQRRNSTDETFNELPLYSSQTHTYHAQPYTSQYSSQLHQGPKQEEPDPLISISQPIPRVPQKPHQAQPQVTQPQNKFDNTPKIFRQTSSQVLPPNKPNQKTYSKKGAVMTAGCEFQWLLGESCKSTYKFDKRLQNQRSLIGLMQIFKQKAISTLSEWLQSKNRGQSRYKYTEQSNRITLVEANKMQLKVALLTTQNILINERQRVFFNEDSIKNLKRQFKIYQNLFRRIVSKIKTEPTLKLRVPLAVYLQYKGVTCIAFSQHSQQQNVDIENNRWSLEKMELIQEGYQLQWFHFKAVGPYLVAYVKTNIKNIQKDEQYLKDYLKKIIKVGRIDKNHNLAFQPPIDRTFLDIAYKENASTSVQSLERYVKGLKYAKGLQGACPRQQIIAALGYCIYCKHLRKVYRSAQGEIDETHFFNLIFKKDSSIRNLLQQSGCPAVQTIKGQLFSFIEHYFGVQLQIDEKVFHDQYANDKYIREQTKKDLFLSSSVKPILRQLPIQVLETMQSISKLSYYLESGHPLAGPALQKKRSLHLLSSQPSIDQSLELLYNQATFHFCESDFIGCIKKCKKYEQLCPAKHTKLLLIYLLMMKAYSEFSQADFTLTLRKATDLIQFNYGKQHSCFINLFSLAGFYYSKLAQKPNNQRSLNLGELAVKLVRQAQQLCIHHFGTCSKQYLDILLDLSRLHRSLDPNLALSFFKEAKNICQSNLVLATTENALSILSYQTQLYLQMGLTSQSDNALQIALTYYDSSLSNKVKRHLSKLQYELGLYMQRYGYCEEAIQRLWQIGNAQKLEAVQLAYKIAMRQSAASQSDNLIDENDSTRFQTKQKAMLSLQQVKYQHSSNLVELISNAIDAKDTSLLTLVFYLINR